MNCNDVPPKSVVLQGWGWAGYNMRMNINIWSISSWWLSHPFEKYARQIGSSPQGPKLKNSWSHHLLSDTLNGFRNPAPIWHAMKTHTVDGRNPAPVEVGSLSHSLQGFIHPRWCRFSSINSNSEIKYQTLLVLGVGFLKFQVAYLPSTISWASKGSVDGSEIRNNNRLDVQNLVNNGVNYLPQLVSRSSEPSTVLLHSPAPSLPAIWPCWASKQIANAW